MNVVAWVLLGLAVGWLASALTRGADYGRLGFVVIGVIGGISAGFIASILFVTDVTGFAPTTLLFAAAGAVGLILLLRAIPGPQPFE